MALVKKTRRFLCGEISRCCLHKKGSKGQYFLHLNGTYEDDKSLVDGYFSSDYPVKVFAGEESPLSNKEIEEKTKKKKFKGRIMIMHYLYDDGGEWNYLSAVSIEQEMGDDDWEPQDDTNPFLENPLGA